MFERRMDIERGETSILYLLESFNQFGSSADDVMGIGNISRIVIKVLNQFCGTLK